MYFDIRGNKITHAKWSALWCFRDHEHLMHTNWTGEIIISTRWVGISAYSFHPNIFETYVFNLASDRGDVHNTYRTAEEAISGHCELVESLGSDPEEFDELLPLEHPWL